MSGQDSTPSKRNRYAALASCLEHMALSEPDEVMRAWKKYEAAVIRDLARRQPSPRGAQFVDGGIYELVRPQLESLWRDADDADLDMAGFERLVLDNYGAGTIPYLAKFLGAMLSWKNDSFKLKEAIGRRLLWVIEESGEQEAVMDAMEEAARNRGLVPPSIRLRRDNPYHFIMDLWLDNPEIQERVNLNAEWLDPLRITDVFSAIDALQ